MNHTASDIRLYFVTQTTAQRLKKFADRRLQGAAGVSTAQAAVLTLIDAAEPVSQREISRQLHQQESAVTTMVSRLSGLGFIERVRSANDHRVWELTLTAAGKSALHEAKAAFDAVNDLFSSVLEERELRALAATFERLNAALSDREA